MKRSMALLIVMTLIVVACDGDDETVELTTTTTVGATTDTTQAELDPPAGTTNSESEDPDDDTATNPVGESVDDYDVMVQTAGADGDELWILIDPGSYTSVDLENFVIDLLDSAGDPIRTLHVFDDAAALDAGRIDPGSRTDAEQALIDQHYLVRVTDGVTAEFQGPYAAFGGFTFGS